MFLPFFVILISNDRFSFHFVKIKFHVYLKVDQICELFFNFDDFNINFGMNTYNDFIESSFFNKKA